MNVWMISPEMAPFSKIGGLGDVVGALPQALGKLGVKVTVAIPYLPGMAEKHEGLIDRGIKVEVHGPSETVKARVLEKELGVPGVRVLFIDCPFYFNRECLYGTREGEYWDNAQRFSFFARASLLALKKAAPRPDVIHAHDWPAGLVPFYARAAEHFGAEPQFKKARLVMSIHNLSYQGKFPKELLPELGIGWERFNHLELEFWDTINFLKAGLVYSDAIVAVSPTYAQEIRTHEHGWWLEGVLSERRDRLYGIINGIDTEVFDPSRDSDIKAVYSAKSPKKRAPNKTALREELNLPQWETPLIGMVSRFVSQKGLDILLEMGDRIPHLGVQWALLGTGEAHYEEALKGLAAKYPEHVSVSIGFSDALARRIYAGSDFFFMPSLFEPCGLGQMIALRYGSLPIVRRTGGLNDTVPDIGLPDGVGIVFDHPTADDASHAVWRAKELWQNKKFMEKVVKRGMEKDFSWTGSARQYKELYEKLQNEQGKSPTA